MLSTNDINWIVPSEIPCNPPNEKFFLSLMLTQKCNLSCAYCFTYNNSEQNIDKTITISKWYQKINEALNFILTNKNIKIVEIEFFGGEPLLEYNLIKDIINYINDIKDINDSILPLKIIYKLPTNFLLMDDKKIKFLKSNNVDISFSFDGLWTKKNRTKNNFFIEKKEWIKSLNLNYCHCVIYPLDLINHSILDNYLYLKNEYNLEPEFDIVKDYNIWNENSLKILINQLNDFYLYFEKNTNQFINIPMPFKEWVIKIIILNLKNIKSLNCGMQHNKLLISPILNFEPCHIFVSENKNDKILSKNEYKNKFTEVLINETCSKCEIKDICKKGCQFRIIENNNIPEKEVCQIFKSLAFFSYKIVKSQNKKIKEFLNKIIKNEGF